jgi:hypothetical protein
MLDALANVVANSFFIQVLEVGSERSHQLVLHASQMRLCPLLLYRLGCCGSWFCFWRFGASGFSDSTNSEHTGTQTFRKLSSVHVFPPGLEHDLFKFTFQFGSSLAKRLVS